MTRHPIHSHRPRPRSRQSVTVLRTAFCRSRHGDHFHTARTNGSTKHVRKHSKYPRFELNSQIQMSRARGSWSIVRSRRNFKYFTCASLLILLLVTVNTRSSTLILQEDSLPDVKCRMVGATDPIFIFCNWPGDWSCRSELFTVLAEQFSTKVRTFVFSTECMVFDLRPRIFFVGGLTDVEQAQQHPFYASSDSGCS